MAGGEPELLLEDACHPAWSPDGDRLAYVSVARDEPRRLWVAEPDGSGATEVAGLDAPASRYSQFAGFASPSKEGRDRQAWNRTS